MAKLTKVAHLVKRLNTAKHVPKRPLTELTGTVGPKALEMAEERIAEHKKKNRQRMQVKRTPGKRTRKA